MFTSKQSERSKQMVSKNNENEEAGEKKGDKNFHSRSFWYSIYTQR